MAYYYLPRGVCAREFFIELDGEKIKKIEIRGGCDGNLKGITHLLAGMNVKEAIERMRGIRCGHKETSCPDQLSIALEKALENK